VKLRIVLDTNVVVAGLRSSLGASSRVLALVGTGQFVHAVSVALLFEYESAVVRPETGVRLPRAVVDDVLDYLCSTAERQRIYFLWRPMLPDPSDDLVLEVAAHAQCDRIVTFNVRDFRGSERFGIRALTPAAFLRSLEEQS
jgi:putative PIN family toxin of toxin-antitoxin system